MNAVDFWRDPGPFTVSELATVCHVSPGLVRKAIKAGVLHSCRAGRSLRIPRSEARRWAVELGAEDPECGNPAHVAHVAHLAHGGK